MIKNTTYAFIFIFSCFLSEAQTIDVVTGLSGPLGMAHNNDELYISDSNQQRIVKVNITNPNPILEEVVTGLVIPTGLLLIGNELYISVFNSGISKIDISSANPVEVDVITGLDGPFSLVLVGNELYISELFAGRISKIDITDSNPVRVDVVTGLASPVGLALVGNYLYISEVGIAGEPNTSKISKIDITLPNPTPIVVISSGLANPNGLLVIGNEMLVAQAGSDRISKFDYTASNPVLSDVVTELESPNSLLIVGDEIYFSQSGKISKFDVSLLSIENSELNSNIVLHPIPANSELIISGLTINQNFKIYNTLGVLVTEGVAVNDEKINIQKFTEGIYFLIFSDGKNFKFIKN